MRFDSFSETIRNSGDEAFMRLVTGYSLVAMVDYTQSDRFQLSDSLMARLAAGQLQVLRQSPDALRFVEVVCKSKAEL